MDKYIFLDIDGVIATSDYLDEANMWTINPYKLELLKNIINKTNAKIVLSSSWRKHSVEDTIKYMLNNSFTLATLIIGVTIRAYHYIDKNERIHLSIPRGVEIKQWIDTHIHSDNGKNWTRKKEKIDFTYIILDDDSDMLLEQKDNFIQCNSNIGLTEEIVEIAIKKLNNE